MTIVPPPPTAESPWPVALLASKVRDWIDRLGTAWVEGEITQWNVSGGNVYGKLRDLEHDATVSFSIWSSVKSRVPADLKQGDRVIAAVERARYAPPTAVLEDPAQDVEAVVDAVGESRQLGARVRALLLPGAGTAAVASTYRRAVESTAAVVRRARALLTRRPR